MRRTSQPWSSQSQSPSSQSSTKNGRHGPSKLSKVSTLSQSPPRKKLKPLTSFSNAPIYDLTRDDDIQPSKGKGKAKAASQGVVHDGRLWAEQYAPDEAEALVVHKKKVEDVRRWLLDSINGDSRTKKYRRILALTGPAGAGKTAVIRVLARELNLDILEWENSNERGRGRGRSYADTIEEGYDDQSESLTAKYLDFFTRASSCSSVFSSPLTSQSSTAGSRSVRRRHIVLLEDIPNVLHPQVQESVHDAFRYFVEVPAEDASPCVVIVSDAGLRGESEDGTSSFRRGKEVMDIRAILPNDLLKGPFVHEIQFNSIAPTFMRRALQAILDSAKSTHPNFVHPTKDVVDAVIESSQGDIRSAINALEFVCSHPNKDGKNANDRKKSMSRAMLEVVTRKENSLVLFHLMGKVMYNKRKGDPPPPKATKADIQRDKEIDSRLRDPPSLSTHLQSNHRRTLRDDVEDLCSNSPIDSSLFSLYIHQNYPPYCDDVDQCTGVADWISWVDANGPESWMQVNPHRFQLITRGTLHSLPSPVTRRGQKQFKPSFFDNLKKEREAAEAVRSVQDWLHKSDDSNLASGWNRTRIVLDLPLVLNNRTDVPSNHTSFSHFASAQIRAKEINADGGETEMDDDDDHFDSHNVLPDSEPQIPEGGELDGDEIENF